MDTKEAYKSIMELFTEEESHIDYKSDDGNTKPPLNDKYSSSDAFSSSISRKISDFLKINNNEVIVLDCNVGEYSSSEMSDFDRELFAVVASVANCDYIRTFSPVEQLSVGIDITNGLGMPVVLSSEAKFLAEELKKVNFLDENNCNNLLEGESMDKLNGLGGKKI